MKKSAAIAIILLFAGLAFMITRGIMRVNMHYEYSNTIKSNWDLSERASTIKQKAEYIDKFVTALEKCQLEGVNSALIFHTPEAEFDENMKALKSLQQRLKDISSMDENSFAYQTAMQQITAQEQGEAHDMLRNIQRSWEKKMHYTLWNPLIGIAFVIIQIVCIIVACIRLLVE